MRGGQLLWDCWREAYIAVSFTWEGAGCTFWIGTAILDRLFSYPERRKLSSSCFPIHFMAARGPDDPHVGLMIRTWAR